MEIISMQKVHSEDVDVDSYLIEVQNGEVSFVITLDEDVVELHNHQELKQIIGEGVVYSIYNDQDFDNLKQVRDNLDRLNNVVGDE